MIIGDIIKIRNNAGVIDIKIVEEMDKSIVGRFEGLGSFEKCRLEFHKDNYGGVIVTLYDNKKDNLTFYIIDVMFGEANVYRGVADRSEKEESFYTTIY